MSNIISVRVNDTEKDILMKAASVYSGGVSSMIKKIVFEKLEEEYDLKTIEAYEKKKEKGETLLYSLEDTWKELGL